MPTEGLMTTRDFCRIGSAFGLAFVLGGPAAHAQDGGSASSGQPAASPAAKAPAGAASSGDVSRPIQEDEQSIDLNTKKAQSPPPPRMSSFNRVTTTRKEVVPARGPSQAARVGRPGGSAPGAGAAPR